MLAQIAAGLLLVALITGAMRRNWHLGLGLLLGAGCAWAGVTFTPALRLTTIPLWLPPLPFALIAFALFFFGFLAWFWGTPR